MKGISVANRKVYLVDTENVGTTWKEILPQKNTKDLIILFYTENSPGISYKDLNIIRQYPSSFDMILCYSGKNGLDFQLVSYLGYLIKTAPKSEYIIISNDVGYDAVVKFWCDREIEVLHVSKTELMSSENKKELYKSLKSMMTQILPKDYHTNEYLERVCRTLQNYDLKELQMIHSALLKEFGNEIGREVYHCLKPQMKNIYDELQKAWQKDV